MLAANWLPCDVMNSVTVCFWEEGVKAGCFDSLPFPSCPTGLACGLISLSIGVAKRKRSFFCNTLSKISLGKDCCSVAQLCPTLCKPVNCSTPGFPALTTSQSLLKLMSAESVMPSSHPLDNSYPLLPSSPPSAVFSSIKSFPMSQFFTSGGQSIWASASVLSMNIQGW